MGLSVTTSCTVQTGGVESKTAWLYFTVAKS
jgi:hypothetical protein